MTDDNGAHRDAKYYSCLYVTPSNVKKVDVSVNFIASMRSSLRILVFNLIKFHLLLTPLMADSIGMFVKRELISNKKRTFELLM